MNWLRIARMYILFEVVVVLQCIRIVWNEFLILVFRYRLLEMTATVKSVVIVWNHFSDNHFLSFYQWACWGCQNVSRRREQIVKAMSLQNEPSSFHARTAEDRTWAKKEAGANSKIRTTN